MKISAHYASLGNSLLGIVTCKLRLGTVLVLVCKVGDNKVGVINRIVVTLISLLQSSVGIIITELAERTERHMVILSATGSKNIICRVVENHLLRIINTLGSSHIADIVGIHIGKSSLTVSIRSIVRVITYNTLLRYLEFALTG